MSRTSEPAEAAEKKSLMFHVIIMKQSLDLAFHNLLLLLQTDVFSNPCYFFSPLWTDGQAEQDGTQQRVWSPAVAALPCIWSAGRMKRVGLTCDLAEQDIDHQNTKTQIPKTTTAEERSPWQHSREIAGPDYSGEWLTLCVLGFQLTAWQPETFLAHCNICTLAIA